MRALDFFHRANADYVERLYAQFQRDPRSLDGSWQAFFAGFEAGSESPMAAGGAPAAVRPSDGADSVYDLVHSYRELGHFVAQLDPLLTRRPDHPLLELSEFGFSEADFSRQVGSGGFAGSTDGTLGDLIERVKATYCGTLGVEYMDISDKEQRAWLQERMEPIHNRPEFSADECRRILSHLVSAETFERFLHTKFVGQKRFSIEGAESLIPLLDTVIEEGAALGVEEIVMGMAHRGRLNVLAHVVHKPYELILSEFAGTDSSPASEGDGDVKYHLGFSDDRLTAGGRKIHCSLSSNPSHLELVDPVIQGMVRAKQEHRGDKDHSRVMPLLIHGEAAFTGQGIVPETLNLSELRGYRTGGTIHIIVNNQVGFTATAQQTRFTPYPTDVARMIQSPVFHVNGDDPQAVVHAARLAIGFRQKFKMDVMIDLWCYRRHGHNEADDATFTQPLLYERIADHPSVTSLYAQRLEDEGKIEPDEADEMKARAREQLDSALDLARERRPRQRFFTLGGLWTGLGRGGVGDATAETKVAIETLRSISSGAARVPEDFAIHPKLKRLHAARIEMANGERPVDFSCAELWALGSLLLEGTPVRLVGQDTERGTFNQRHAVLHDVKKGARYIPLAHLSEKQGSFLVVNTMLSELAVLGFEYGYSSADPRTLVMWEAQFGDFVNAAQPILDQFLASAESKWQRMSGLVLLLPHGYEGQGPEHSSARIERFLQLCAEKNLQVCYPTHPAQYFHVLRRQMHRSFRKPLILLTPKSLLRDDRSTSSLKEFSEGSFRLVIDDPRAPDRDQVKRLLLCSGRIYFPLAAARDKHQRNDAALVRIEQLYPFPRQEIQALIARYRHAHEVVWVQEEPRNMGAWSFIEPRLRDLLPDASVLSYQGRDEAASPATGSFAEHQAEEEALLQQALDVRPEQLAAQAAGDGSPVTKAQEHRDGHRR